MCKVGLVIIILTIVLSVGILSCGNESGNIPTSPTLKFVLIPHEPGEAPMVPHPLQSFDDCALCHIDTSNIGSSIKVFTDHTCWECHERTDYSGPCYETSPINSCIFDVCHRFP